MGKLIWVTVAFLVAVTSAGVLFLEQPIPVTDRRALVELVINESVKGVLEYNQYNLTNPKSRLIILSTPSFRGLRVPFNVQGVLITVLTQGEIDDLSRVQSLDYVVFERVDKVDAYSAEVEVTFFWSYFDGMEHPFGASGVTYFCSNQSGEWVITGGEGWIS